MARHLSTTAKVAHPWNYEHDACGYNYRLPNINAALGCAQLKGLPDLVKRKRLLFESYAIALAEVEGVEIVEEPSECSSNYWLQTLKLSEVVAKERDSILEATNESGLMTRPVWKLLHTLIPYKECPRAPLPIAESLEQRLINLPSSAGLI